LAAGSPSGGDRRRLIRHPYSSHGSRGWIAISSDEAAGPSREPTASCRAMNSSDLDVGLLDALTRQSPTPLPDTAARQHTKTTNAQRFYSTDFSCWPRPNPLRSGLASGPSAQASPYASPCATVWPASGARAARSASTPGPSVPCWRRGGSGGDGESGNARQANGAAGLPGSIGPSLRRRGACSGPRTAGPA
jgi:hypothetical protein